MKKLLFLFAFLPFTALAQTPSCCIGDGLIPSITFGPGAGVAPYGITVFGDDGAGIASFFTGVAPTTGKVFTITFNVPYLVNVIAAPFPSNIEGADYYYNSHIWSNTRFADHFDIYTGNFAVPLPPNTLIQIGYVIQK